MKCSWFVFGVMTLYVATARADDSPAGRLFDEGMRLIDEGKIGDGCEKLSESYRIDPGFGVLYNLADCHERVGRTATAWTEFYQASELAARMRQAERHAKAQKRMSALESRLVRLTVHVESKSGESVSLDGTTLPESSWDKPLPIDPGTHRLEATAPSRKTWRSAIEIGTSGSFVTATVPLLERDGAAQEPKPIERTSPVVEPKRTGIGTQRALAIGLGGLGVASLGVGTVMSFVAKSTYDSSGPYCQGNQCQGEGVDLRNKAFGQAAAATGLFVGAGVALAGSTVLWLTAPKNKTTVGVSGSRVVLTQTW